MNHRRNLDLRLWEAMEACRPQTDDLKDPLLALLADRLASDAELQQRYQRLQRLDQSLADAFRDVPVPQGLAERILERLNAGGAGVRGGVQGSGFGVQGSGFGIQGMDDKASDCLPSPLAPRACPPSHVRLSSRRWFLTGAACFAVAAVVFLAVAWQLTRPRPVDGARLPEAAIAYYESESHEGGRDLSQAPPLCPFSGDVQQFPDVSWRWVRGFVGQDAVAYDLVAANGGRGTLYVISGKGINLPVRPSPEPYATTRGRSATAWQQGAVVYVLVVEGSPATYQQFLVAPREPLT
jgi:hypothetical protein